ncbi:MAG TPA: LCP family protein [Jiangellales bacterium]|nr:LCP family protein [Jiangellales bacterium]
MANATDQDILPLGGDDPEESRVGRRRRRRRGRRVLLIAVGALVTLTVLAVGGTYVAVDRVTGDIERIPQVFEPIPEEQRPQKPAAEEPGADGLTFLLAGLDRRSDVPTTGTSAQTSAWRPGAARTDAVLVVHITGDRSKAYVVSIPRDSWVDIPGRGRNKINAAYSFGGPSLFVQTVEQLTDLRIDHLAVIDWHGFRNLTDAVGGVTMTFDQPVVARGRTFPPGTHTLSGEEALDYVGERYALPGGDFDRVRRQQNWMRALMQELLSRETLTNPGTLTEVADAVAQTTSVDDSLSGPGMVRMALEMRNIRSEDVTFLTVPTKGTGRAGAASIVVYDDAAAEGLWRAVESDALEEWLAANPGSTLGAAVN